MTYPNTTCCKLGCYEPGAKLWVYDYDTTEKAYTCKYHDLGYDWNLIEESLEPEPHNWKPTRPRRPLP